MLRRCKDHNSLLSSGRCMWCSLRGCNPLQLQGVVQLLNRDPLPCTDGQTLVRGARLVDQAAVLLDQLQVLLLQLVQMLLQLLVTLRGRRLACDAQQTINYLSISLLIFFEFQICYILKRYYRKFS